MLPVLLSYLCDVGLNRLKLQLQVRVSALEQWTLVAVANVSYNLLTGRSVHLLGFLRFVSADNLLECCSRPGVVLVDLLAEPLHCLDQGGVTDGLLSSLVLS